MKPVNLLLRFLLRSDYWWFLDESLHLLLRFSGDDDLFFFFLRFLLCKNEAAMDPSRECEGKGACELKSNQRFADKIMPHLLNLWAILFDFSLRFFVKFSSLTLLIIHSVCSVPFRFGLETALSVTKSMNSRTNRFRFNLFQFFGICFVHFGFFRFGFGYLANLDYGESILSDCNCLPKEMQLVSIECFTYS